MQVNLRAQRLETAGNESCNMTIHRHSRHWSRGGLEQLGINRKRVCEFVVPDHYFLPMPKQGPETAGKGKTEDAEEGAAEQDQCNIRENLRPGTMLVERCPQSIKHVCKAMIWTHGGIGANTPDGKARKVW